MARTKNIVMTGATSGFGIEYAKQLMMIPNTTIYLLARNRSKFEELQQFASNIDSIHFVYCDLLDIESILSAIGKVLAQTKSIDLLIHNAGLFPSKTKQLVTIGQQKVEHAFMVNHLAPLVITLLLEDALNQSLHARVVNTSSFQHANGSLNNFDFMFEKSSYSAMSAYQNSKLYHLVTCAHLASILSPNIACYAFDPGIVDTQMTQQAMPAGLGLLYPFLRYFFRDPVKGAETGVYLATQSLNTHKNMLYFRDRKPKKPHNLVRDSEIVKQLFKTSFLLIKDVLLPINTSVIYDHITDLKI